MSRVGWKLVRLAQLALINAKSISKNYPYKEIEYIDTSSVKKNEFGLLPKIKLSEAPSRAKRIIQHGDTIISTVRPIQKHFGFIRNPKPNTIASTGFAVITPKSINPEFLYYYLSQDSITNYLNGIAETSTTTFPAFRPEVLSDLEILIPEDGKIQRRIADILSALDDKIELNRQTNATLEAIAQAIFKEWFVDFNFPGATGELVESELGMIPKGWRIGSVAEILILANETVSPGSNPDKLFYHYSIPAFDSGRVPSQELGSAILSNKYKVKSNSILVSKLNPRIPRVWPLKEVNQESSVCSTEFQVLLPQKAHYYSFAANLFSQTSMIDTMKSRASGTSSSHQRIIPQDILDINIIIPNDDLLALFDEIVGNYYHCIINGLEESVILAKIRDSLLPKLMNGEIEV